MTYICQCGCGREIPPSYLHGHRYEPKYLRGHNTKTVGFAAQAAQAKAQRHEELPTLICQCGCGEVIPPKPNHRYRQPMYIHAHYLKMGTHLRIIHLRESLAKRRTQPPEGWVPPSGLCECGCGKPTKLVKYSKPEWGEYCGHPMRFIHGHHSRMRKGDQTPGWKTGTTRRQGYVLVKLPGHPAADRIGYVPEHRLVYEMSRGVTLTKDLHIHHVNGIRDDNRPENLMALTKGDHKRMHQIAQEVIGAFLDPRLNQAVCEHVRTNGTLPDLEALTQQIYGHATDPTG